MTVVKKMKRHGCSNDRLANFPSLLYSFCISAPNKEHCILNEQSKNFMSHHILSFYISIYVYIMISPLIPTPFPYLSPLSAPAFQTVANLHDKMFFFQIALATLVFMIESPF